MEGVDVSGARAVILMSGGDAVTPFTTPDTACASGLVAGNTYTALRSHLLQQGFAVYTAPAMNGRGPVLEPEPDSFGAFAGMTLTLPDHLTVNSVGDIDAAGECLARFAAYLNVEHGVEEVDWIGHSNGGTFCRAAIRILRRTGSPVRSRSLTTLSSPWMGSVPLRWVAGEIPWSQAGGDARLEALFTALQQEVAAGDLGLAPENTVRYMDGPRGWNAAQEGVLDGIPVLLVAGEFFDGYAGDPTVWPLDGLVSRSSAWAEGVPPNVLPHARRVAFPVTHSIFVSDAIGEPWETGMTWNAEVLATVSGFLADVRD